MSTKDVSRDQHTSRDFEVRRTMRDGYRVIEKVAVGRRRSQLRYEAAARHEIGSSKLTELLEVRESDSETVLVFRDAGHHTLADPVGKSPAELVRILQDCCNAVRGVHDRGWSHGNLKSEHIVIGSRTRVRLCSAGSATPLDPAGRGVLVDTLALVDIVESVSRLTQRHQGRRARAEWKRFSRGLSRLSDKHAGSRSQSIDSLIDALREMAEEPIMSDPQPRIRRRVVVATSVLATVAGISAVGLRPSGADPKDSADMTAKSAGQVMRAAVTGGTISVDGIEYRIGNSDDQAAVGEWTCDGRKSVILLRPSTGEVFSFEDPAGTDRRQHGELLSVLTNAENLHIGTPRESPDGIGCDTPFVELKSGSFVDPRDTRPEENP